MCLVFRSLLVSVDADWVEAAISFSLSGQARFVVASVCLGTIHSLHDNVTAVSLCRRICAVVHIDANGWTWRGDTDHYLVVCRLSAVCKEAEYS